MKHISIVYEIEKCSQCPFFKSKGEDYIVGYCNFMKQDVIKNILANTCQAMDWGMYSSKKLKQTENEKSS